MQSRKILDAWKKGKDKKNIFNTSINVRPLIMSDFEEYPRISLEVLRYLKMLQAF